MEFRILGPLEVLEEGQSLELGGQQQRALLALLLLEPNRVVSRDRLIAALWEDDPPDSAHKALQVYVSNLRKRIGRDRITTKAPGYAIRVEPGELDLELFEGFAAEGGRRRCAEALALWRGPPLAEFAHRRFALPEIARLEERHLALLEERIEADLARGRQADLVAELESLVAEHPLRERLRALLMLALYRSGRQVEALEVYQDGRRTLVEELGIEPGRELRELQQTILRQDPVLERAQEPEVVEVQGFPSGFVGREAELAELTSSLDDAFASRGRLFLIQGEPGIGKSRLADEVANVAGARGAHVLVGRCWEAGGAPAYWPWTQSLRAYVRKVEPGPLQRQLGQGAADVTHVVPELRDLLSGLPEPEPLESEAARFRLFDSTTSFLRRAASDRPLVFILDDLHAADEPSLMLLRFLASTLADSRILVVATFRDLDPTLQAPLDSTLTELGREAVSRRIHLCGLSEQEVGQLAEATAQAAPNQGLVAALYADTEGNPLFVSEIVRLLAAEHLLFGVTGRIPIPQTVREAIGRRLRHLSGECRRVLSLASVFGREFGLVALERVADYTGIDKLLSVLDEAIAARVAEEIPGAVGRLRFGHALTRDTLYEEIPATHRARLHRRVGEVLEDLYSGNPELHLAELAHHFLLAVPAAAAEKAVDYAWRAGDQATELLAFEEAARLYGNALDLLEVAPDARRRCELLLSLGEAQIRAGEAATAREAFFEAAGIARRLGLTHHLGRAAAGFGGRIVWARAGEDPRLVPLLEEALANTEAEDVALRATLLARLACALRDEPSRERRDALSAEAVELGRRAGDAAVLGYVLDARSHAMVAPDTVEDCLALAGELEEVAARSADRERVIAAHMLRAHAELLVGHVVEAKLALAEAARVAQELRQPAQLWLVSASAAMLALAEGDLTGAEVLVARSLTIGEKAQRDAAIPHDRLQRYTLASFRGGLDEVESDIRALVADYPSRPVFRCVLAHLLAVGGQDAEATGILDQFVADEGLLPFDQEWLFGMSLLAETASLVGDARSWTAIYDRLSPWANLNAVDVAEGFRGSIARYLGLLAMMLESWETAAKHFENAIAANRRMLARPWLAQTEEDYARMLLARGDAGDVERARELIKAAVGTYREIGMEAYAARASSLAVGPAVQAP